MDSKELTNIQDGTNDADVVSKKWIEEHVANQTPNVSDYVKKDGSISVTGNLDMANNNVINMAEGTDNSHAITKHQLETGLSSTADKSDLNNFLDITGGEMRGDVNLGFNRIFQIQDATVGDGLVSNDYIDRGLQTKADKTSLADYLKKDGSVAMNGDLAMSNHKSLVWGVPQIIIMLLQKNMLMIIVAKVVLIYRPT